MLNHHYCHTCQLFISFVRQFIYQQKSELYVFEFFVNCKYLCKIFHVKYFQFDEILIVDITELFIIIDNAVSIFNTYTFLYYVYNFIHTNVSLAPNSVINI